MSRQSGALFSTNESQRQAFIVYINGIEVPCKSVSQRYGVWQLPEMSLEMVADPVLTRLGAEDRVQVQVFYLDNVRVDSSVKPQFRIFGEGEITGWGYQHTSSGRSIVFTCVNQIAVLTQLFVQFLTSLDDIMAHETDKGAGTTSVSVPSSEIVFPFSLFSQGVIPGSGAQAPATITRPFDFLYNVIKNMIGAQVPGDHRAIPATNFFARWARLTNFHNRFVAMPFFDDVDDKNVFPVLKALQNTSAVDVISNNLLPQVQNAGSLWDMLQLVYQTVFMEIAMIPTMPLVSVDLATSKIQTTDFDAHKVVANEGRYVPASTPDPKTPHRLANYFAKPQTLFGLPPSCNVIFPSQLKMFAYDENYATQPTRLYFNDETVSRLLKIPQGGYGETVMNSLATAYPPEADTANQLKFIFPRFNGKNFLLFPEEFFKGPVMDRRNIPPWLFFLKASENQAARTDWDGNPVDGPSAPPPAPAQTGKPTVTVTPIVPANTMVTGAQVGSVGPTGKRVFSDNVEGLRQDVTRLTQGTSIPLDFALAWIQQASDGSIKKISSTNERGYFQVQGPYVRNDGTVLRFKDSKAAELGLTETDTGSGTDSPLLGETPPTLSTDREASLRAGVALVLNCRRQADNLVSRFNLTWSEGDRWRLAKLFHEDDEAAVLFVSQAVASGASADWLTAYNAVLTSMDARHQTSVKNATGVGSVVPTASGTTIDEAQRVVRAGAATPPSATPRDVTASTQGTASSNAAAGTPSTEAVTAQVVEERQSVYQLYAKYEFFRERYSRRTGSALIEFNPYVVPGFPATIFDRRDTRVDLFCYITTVQQRLTHTKGGQETTLSFAYGRTIQEMFDLMRQEFDGGAAANGTGPQEPIRDIRKVVQNFATAEKLYQRLFYGGQALYGKDASFDYRNIIGFQPDVPTDPVERIVIDGPDEASLDAVEAAKQRISDIQQKQANLRQQIATLQQQQLEAQKTLRTPQAPVGQLSAFDENFRLAAQASFDSANSNIQTLAAQLAALDADVTAQTQILANYSKVQATQKVSHNITGDREVVPLPSAEGAFEDYDVAMRYNWRPICTLDEYLLFYNSVGESPIPASNHPRSIGVVYYERIRRMTPLTEDFTIPVDADGLSTAKETPTAVPGIRSGTGPYGVNAPGDFPQTRDDWDKVLIAYRNNVYYAKAPRT